ncbi:universal stress protein [Rhodothermaceae bacterium RA]|nr:universal stress protein [Rhodothermaceae bacterium RA]
MATSHQDTLRRELGFWDALTIGAGTMIGAGIFLLAGVALELTGPAAIFSYLGAGLVCLITAASAAELATGMPTSGGDYYFVSRSLGPAFGAISGVGIWLSLTFAIAFYLYGLGEYLAQFTPLTPFWGAVLGGVLLTALNVIGAKESGRTQVIVVLTLLGILGLFSVVGVFHLEGDHFTPFFPFGAEPIFSTTALVFVSFLGFVKIAAVAEEIKDPARNLPRALIGSVALVTLLYILILLVIAGLFPQQTIGEVRDPLTQAARRLFGGAGGVAIIFAGLLATLSSANASIMASSRINLAMARDRMVPNWLAEIHQRMLTPYRAILVTGLLALAFLAIESLEQLAKIASVLQLYSYAALNIGCVMLRAANPDWYRPSYRVPGSPYLQLGAALGCLAIIVFSGLFAKIAVGILIVVSLGWYALWGRPRVTFEHAGVDFQKAWSQQGWRVFFAPAPRYGPAAEIPVTPPLRPIDTAGPRRLMVALANPHHEADLLRLARFVATGRTAGGDVVGIHLHRVPLQTPLDVARERLDERVSVERTIARLLQQETLPAADGLPLARTRITTVTDVAHDVFGSLISETQRREADLLLMGWQGGFTVGRIYNSPVQRILAEVRADVAVLKNRGLEHVGAILLPWGGGLHARLGLEVAVRVARATGATIDLLRVVRQHVDAGRERQALAQDVAPILDGFERVRYLVQEEETVTSGIQAALEAAPYDLVIIGASHESRLRNVLFGSIPDVVADRADCSVLMVRRYVPALWSVKASQRLKRIKETLGLTTSAEPA